MVELIDDADRAQADISAFLVAKFAGILAVDDDGAAIWFFQKACQVQQG